MDDVEAIEGLKRLGLTTYEARVYLALRKLGSGTASEISDIEEVPRSQVYGAAEGLEERGLVETQQSTPTVYRPVPLEQARKLLLDQLAQTGTETFDYLDTVTETRDEQEESESIWLINTQDAIVSRTVSIVESADDRLLYGVHSPDHLEDEILEALERTAAKGVTVVVASAEEDALDLIPADSKLHPFRVPEERDLDVSTGRVLIADGHTILLSTLSTDTAGDGKEAAFWTSENQFASVIVELVEAWFQDPFE
jgi:sugar-specific transcriptional regulator TrmB